MSIALKLENLRSNMHLKQGVRVSGKVTQVIGLIVESVGPPCSMGDLCDIQTFNGTQLAAEVVGFKEGKVLLMPLDNLHGIAPGSEVIRRQKLLSIPVGRELLGRVIDPLGKPLDQGAAPNCREFYPLHNTPPNPLLRKRINEHLGVGIRAIDGLLTCGKGQRVGLFAGSGVGKSVLLGRIARDSEADVNVIALIGERGREVREFIEKDLGEQGLKRSVVIVATSDQPALLKIKGALAACAVAEYFRDQNQNVMLLMDSATRLAMAQREIGLSVGEPPTAKGYTPSVFSLLPQVLERAGTSDVGSITGMYTVLVEADDMNDPVADAIRAILDGHIVLSRKIAARNHYPAIDVLQSISRVMSDVVQAEQLFLAGRMKDLLAAYTEAEDLINIGAYVAGSNKRIDDALSAHDDMRAFLCQDMHESVGYQNALQQLLKIMEPFR